MKLFIWVLAIGALCAENVRFDHKVRELYFAGFAGDRESLAKAMVITEATLKDSPEHAEAMVWHGGALFLQSGEKFRAQDTQGGMALYQKGTGMMDKAVELAPKHIGVLIPRGSIYMAGGRAMPPQMGKPLLEKALHDFETAWNLQKKDLSQFSQHSIGELWFGIADASDRLGNKEKATEFFKMIQTKLPNTPWAKRADKWFAEGTLGMRDTGCIGCHMGSPKAFQN